MVDFLTTPPLNPTSPVRPVRPSERRKKSSGSERTEFSPPESPYQHFIPTPEVLENLVERGLSALSRGIYWDRGSIINMVL